MGYEATPDWGLELICTATRRLRLMMVALEVNWWRKARMKGGTV
jgi:hypothetical protein